VKGRGKKGGKSAAKIGAKRGERASKKGGKGGSCWLFAFREGRGGEDEN